MDTADSSREIRYIRVPLIIRITAAISSSTASHLTISRHITNSCTISSRTNKGARPAAWRSRHWYWGSWAFFGLSGSGLQCGCVISRDGLYVDYRHCVFYAKHTGCSVRNLWNLQNKGTGSHRQGAGHRRAGSGDCIPGHLGHCSSFCRAGNRNLWLLFQRSVLLMNPMITQQVL